MKYYEEDGIRFAQLTPAMEALIENYRFDRAAVVMDEIRMVEKALELYSMGTKELQAVRNSVVKYLADRADEILEKRGRCESWDQMRYNMSAVVAVIDNCIYNW